MKKCTRLDPYVSSVFGTKTAQLPLSRPRMSSVPVYQDKKTVFYSQKRFKSAWYTPSVEYRSIWENFLHVLKCWSLARFDMWPNLNTYVRRIASIYDYCFLCTSVYQCTNRLFSSKKTIVSSGTLGNSECARRYK